MDAVTQIAQKMAAERARNVTPVQPPPETDPPPYSLSEDDDDDSDSDNEEDSPPVQPLKLTINAAHSIRGTNNLVPTSPSPLSDATKFSTLLLHSINQINNAQNSSRRPLRVDLTINCGITVIGDRNVIGAVGLRPKGGSDVIEGAVPDLRSSAVVGAKRKAEEVSSAS
jgi:hypothetical protein